MPLHAPLQVGANLLERDEKALVVSTGYFGDRFADWYQPCARTQHSFLCYL
jgi:aspartate aminotransferase-like enzyme